MARIEIDFGDFEEKLEKLERNMRLRTARKMLEAGSDVLIEADRTEIKARGHVRSGSMWQNVKSTGLKYYQGSYTEIYSHDEDANGVRNWLKEEIINFGYPRSKHRKIKKDPFIKRVAKSAEARVQQAMESAFEQGVKEAGIN